MKFSDCHVFFALLLSASCSFAENGVTEREIVIAAEPWVKPATMPFVVVARSESSGTEFVVPVTEDGRLPPLTVTEAPFTGDPAQLTVRAGR